MSCFRARVSNGRLVLDEPTDLPEGSVVELVQRTDGAPDLTAAERRKLEAALDAGDAAERDGHIHDAGDVVSELRRMRRR